jgi:colanic acid/amylovoran biosynthesis protein
MGHILLINVFSTKNKGDAGIALSQIAALQEALPGRSVVVQSWSPDADGPALGCKTVGPFFDRVSERHPEWSGRRQKLHSLSVLLATIAAARGFRPAAALLDSAQREALEAFYGADLVVSVGGNFLYAYAGRNATSFLKHCHQLFLAQALGKPTLLLAQSLGPVQPPRLRRLLKGLLLRARLILVREALSLDFLKDLGVPLDHVRLTPDTAFLLPPGDPEAAERLLSAWGLPAEDGRLRLGMTVRNWEFPGSVAGANDAYKAAVAAVIDRAIETWGARVVLLPQCITPDQDDRHCMRDIAARVRHRDGVTVVEDDIPAAALKAVCGRLDLFVGTRMHSNIFAAAMHTPTAAISYQPKTDGIMAMLGMDDLKIAIEDVTPERLWALLETLHTRRAEVRAHLTERIAALQSDARADLKSALSALGF